MQRASDVLAEKLPGPRRPERRPKVQDDSKTVDGVDTRPLKPLTAARPDRFFFPAKYDQRPQMTSGQGCGDHLLGTYQ